MQEEILLSVAIAVFIFGIAIGSFLNVIIYRIPKGESIVFPASKCQSCHMPLRWWHNIEKDGTGEIFRFIMFR